MSRHTIFLIAEDNDFRLLIRRSLESLGYKVKLAIDEEDALDRVISTFLKADLVLINLLGKTSDEILEIGRNICRIGNLIAPLIVIASKYNKELEGTSVKVDRGEYITYLADGEQLFDLLSYVIAET